MIRLALHHLAVIQGLGKTGSVSATARELGLTQSAISHRMKEAERRIGVLLFVRDGHMITLTPAGRRLLQSADTILGEVSLAERDLERLSSGFQETLKVGAACYAGFDWLSDFLQKMKTTSPTVAVEVIAETAEDPTRLLLENHADLVLAAGRSEKAGIASHFLVPDELVAILAPEQYLAKEPFFDPALLPDLSYVTHHTQPEDGREYDTIFKPMKVMPNRVIRAGRTQAVLELVRHDHGITILPKRAVFQLAKRMGLVIMPVTEVGVSISWYALSKRKSSSNPLIEKAVSDLALSLETLH